jgi:RND family efflux transporter MFP subunit
MLPSSKPAICCLSPSVEPHEMPALSTLPFRAISGRSLVAALALAGVVAGSFDAEAQRRRGGGGEAPAVTVVTVERARINDRVAAVGTARARQQVTLTTRVAGVITEVLFEGGSKVKRGQPLLKLDSEPEAIAVETAEAQRAQAADTVDRYSQLREGTITRVARAEADTALKVADAALRRARDQLERMTIRAPFDGIMGLTNLEPGDYLAVGNPVATIDDRSSLLIEFTVPEAAAPAMKKGLAVRANLIARSGEVYQGKVSAVGTRIDPVSRTLMVRAEIPNPDLSLIPGSTFSISVRLPGQETALLPALAIQWDRQGAYVWRVKDDDTVERVSAAILSRASDRAYLATSLQAGERVVHEGGDSLRAGQKIRAVPAPSDTATSAL